MVPTGNIDDRIIYFVARINIMHAFVFRRNDHIAIGVDHAVHSAKHRRSDASAEISRFAIDIHLAYDAIALFKFWHIIILRFHHNRTIICDKAEFAVLHVKRCFADLFRRKSLRILADKSAFKIHNAVFSIRNAVYDVLRRVQPRARILRRANTGQQRADNQDKRRPSSVQSVHLRDQSAFSTTVPFRIS